MKKTLSHEIAKTRKALDESWFGFGKKKPPAPAASPQKLEPKPSPEPPKESGSKLVNPKPGSMFDQISKMVTKTGAIAFIEQGLENWITICASFGNNQREAGQNFTIEIGPHEFPARSGSKWDVHIEDWTQQRTRNDTHGIKDDEQLLKYVSEFIVPMFKKKADKFGWDVSDMQSIARSYGLAWELPEN